MITPLICVLSPRDITIVKEGHETFDYVPHLWLKYWRAIQAYIILKDFFLKRKEFSHLVISPDDLVVKEEHYLKMIETINDYPAFSGVCNVDFPHPESLAITEHVVPIRRPRHHKWIQAKDAKGIMKVGFSGMPFMFIRRDIVERVQLRGDTPFDVTREWQEPKSFDAGFCYECNQLGIPIHANTDVKMAHLRNAPLGEPFGAQAANLRVGKVPPHVYYNDGAGRIEDLTEEYFRMICEINPYNTKLLLKRKPVI